MNAFMRWIRAHQVKIIVLRRDTLGRVVSGAYNNTVHCKTDACVKANNHRTVHLNPSNTLAKLKTSEKMYDTVEAWCQSEVCVRRPSRTKGDRGAVAGRSRVVALS